jgi:hypothetical protein
MTLSIWEPRDKTRPVRKLYKDGKKVAIDWSLYWREVKAYKNEEITLSLIKELKSKVIEKDLNVCLGTNSPKDEMVNDIGEFRRTLDSLKNEDRNWVLLDCDKCYPEVHPQMSTRERVKVLEDRLPILRRQGLVAWPSSSGYFLDDSIDEKETGLSKHHRLNLHIFILLDKPESAGTIKNFLKSHKDDLDTALGVITQPHLIANPIFENTPEHTYPGQGIYLREEGEC